ncbi:helicase HerA domain-containing protein [Microbispora sp. GKU 823]|uniref:helicase HerA domain-containing protein n=1 Tax=Microbispora sp. GKU 823 TaxID=1652100 RepID=UPI0009A446A9|nr:DUF87 domain-containing protein [Microbispora sp. GKU 823]OPG05042.1 hypothetical protein B1L11_36320 [Microbispora sp. GKU 823]
MAIDDLTAGNLDYLERSGFEPPRPAPGARLTQAPVELRTLICVTGIGRLEKRPRSPAYPDHRTGLPDGEAGSLPRDDGTVPITRDVLAALYTYKVPLAFLAGAEPGRACFRIGTWLPAGSPASTADCNGQLLQSALHTLYPAVDLREDDPATGPWPLGGLVMGIPTLKPPDTADGAAQFDRLLRALHHLRWTALILAQPADEALVHDLKLRLINEMRAAQTATKLGGAPSPLADHYLQLLGAQLKAFTDAQSTGAWRTAVYLLGDAQSYPELASLWRGVFSGDRSLPEPIRVWDRDDVPTLASDWAMIDPTGDTDAPGHYRQPFQHQTLLTSTQLAAYVHFPNLETNGFGITQVPDLDTVPPPTDSSALGLGTVVERQRATTTAYGIGPRKLTRHTFVTGTTGSGKTNTVFHLLQQIHDLGLPFLVLEPAKTEYRALLHHSRLETRLQIYTPGNETVCPLRLNPFEVLAGTPVAVHLDLLRSVFHASFGMWTPLPQILEAALHAVYSDRGWDITTDTNRRLDSDADRSQAFPTLTDLVAKVETLIPQLGYEDKVTGDLRAALTTRLDGLRTGGKGRMLDTRRSTPIEVLLTQPTVLELEGMGDDDDKAFMMGLFVIRLAEHRRTQGDTEDLRHLLVVEEAHRLLANTTSPRGVDEGEADVRGKAVETFTNLLSEVRAYGQGVVIVDQVPTKLASDVVKNTNLKIAHRIVAGDDRETLAASMGMTSLQSTALTTLPIGRAAVFTDGEDSPLLIQVPQTKGGTGTWPTHAEVRDYMAHHGLDTRADRLLPSADCDQRCQTAPDACRTARAQLDDDPRVMRTLARIVFSAVQSRGALDRTWAELPATIEPRRPRWLDQQALLACLVHHAAHRLADSRAPAPAGPTPKPPRSPTSSTAP